jgi:PAS domain S-box-containing protein
MDTLTSLLGSTGFHPLGDCLNWAPGVLWSMVGADAVTAAAFFSVPAAALSHLRRRPDASMKWIAWLFSAFILVCGFAKLMDIWTIWQPDYGLQALAKVVTAVMSLVTALALWPLIQRGLKRSAVKQSRTVAEAVETEVGRRRHAEDRLAVAQQSLAVTLASFDAGFITTDREGQVTHMNARAEAVTGWSLSSAAGLDLRHVLDLWQVVDNQDRAATFIPINLLDSMREEAIGAASVQRASCIAWDGTHTTLEVRTAPTHDAEGQVTGLAVVFRDMSRIDKADVESKRLAAVVESSNDAIISKTLDGRITSWNGGAQSIFGYTADEAIGQPVQMLIPQHLQSEELRIIAELEHGKSAPAFDTLRLRRDGELLDMSITISPIRDSDGRVVGASKIARDVSKQRRTETALRDSEERLRFTLESAHIGDWNLDLATGVMEHSSRYDQCFGYTDQQSHWSFDKFVEHVHAEDRDEVEQTLHVAITELRDWRVQCRVVWPDDSVHWISKHGSVQRNDDKAVRMVGIVSEITEQRQAENTRLTAQRLEAENRQIQEANRLKSQFLANMSHELRTPLNAVIGFADLLHSGFIKPDSPKHQEFLGHIGTSGRHLLQLINDVLDLSKVESGKLEFFPEPVDLTVILKEVQGVLHMAVSRKEISVSTHIGSDLVDLELDPARLKQVLYNYLSNAIKFTATGGRVVVRATGEGPEHFRIEVEDSGIGISDADLPRLFTDFQQLDAGYSKQHQGTGMGLALTRRLVQAQGGHVGVRSTLGVGSVFYVVLNRKDGLDSHRAETLAQGVLEREAERVLVIEDDLRDQALLVQALAQAGFEVDDAAEGPYALRRARETAFAALKLDMSLPNQRGLQLLDDIRSRGASHSAPVVSLTMPADLTNSAAFAIANVLSKPIRSDEVLLAMARFRLPSERRAKVMVIDDEQVSLDLMRATLKSIGIDAVCFQDGHIAIQEIDKHRPDAIVLDLMMPAFDGFQVLDALQRLPAWRDLPVFIWTSMLLTDEEYATLARSARAILIKGGGAMEAVLASVRRWRQPIEIVKEATP